MMTDMPTAQAERDKHRAMMLDPQRWPRWPWLPIKRRGHNQPGTECAAIYADDTVEGEPVTVKFPRPGQPKVYTDVDAVLDDGWIVD